MEIEEKGVFKDSGSEQQENVPLKQTSPSSSTENQPRSGALPSRTSTEGGSGSGDGGQRGRPSEGMAQ